MLIVEFDLLRSIIMTVVVSALTCGTCIALNMPRRLRAGDIVSMLLFGLVTGLATFYAATVSWVAIVGTIVLCLIIVYVCAFACKEASTWYEVVLPLCLIVAVGFAAINVVLHIPEVTSVVKTIPYVVAILAMGVVLVVYFIYHFKGHHLRGEITKGPKAGYAIAAVLSVVIAIALAVGLIAAAVGSPVSADDGSSDSDAKSSVKYHFYNDDLQKDDDVTNDYNFGPSGPLDAKKAQKNHAKRLKKDTVLLAAAMGWVDANTRTTKFLKEYYDSCNGDWEKAMNKAAKAFYKDPELYDKSVKEFIKFLKSADKVFVRDCLDYSSQMYMRPRSNSKGLPEIIALETLLSGGHELVYVFNIDGKSIEVRFRIECGYQPVDVVKVMHIKPQPQPDIDPTNPDIDPTNPNIDPTKPGFNKDPNEAPTKNTEPNDDPGPYEKTKENDDPNSSDRMTYPEYVKNINDLKDINENQKKAGDPNTPSTPKPTEDTNVDNNGDYGYGWGGADDPTIGVAPAKTEDGTEINTQPAGQWGGPTD